MSVQIVKINVDTGKFDLLLDELKDRLLQEDVKDREIVVISIAGAFRQGKSFLLNFFLRYLNKHYVERFLGTETTPNDEELVGFDWKRQNDGVTTGIHMSSEVFKHDYEDGRKIAIVLLDTQGLFDNKTTRKDGTTVFVLSTLLSSVQIFNVLNNIKETDLQNLQFYAGFGQFAAETKAPKLFQKLMFLVRDWCSDDSMGISGGRNYLESHVMNVQQLEHQSLRKHLKDCFKDIDCFLMPHPGENVTRNQDFKGQMRLIKQDFLDNVGSLLSELLDPEKLTVKEINGQPVKAHAFVALFEKYFACLNGEEMPNNRSIYEITSEDHNICLFEKCQQLYAHKMIATDNVSVFTNSDDAKLLMVHERISRETMALFDSKALPGSTSAHYLKEKLVEFFEHSLAGFLIAHITLEITKKVANTAFAVSAGLSIGSLAALPEVASTYELKRLLISLSSVILGNTLLNKSLRFVISSVMCNYEKFKPPPAFSTEYKLIENFWQKYFVLSEKPNQLEEID